GADAAASGRSGPDASHRPGGVRRHRRARRRAHLALDDHMIRVVDPGPQTTVQDLGRVGHLRYDIPPSGAIDVRAFVVANRLAGHSDGAAGLECTVLGPRFAVETACAIAVTGADAPVTVNGTPSPPWTTLVLSPGDAVRIGAARAGVRTYVAFSGGL